MGEMGENGKEAARIQSDPRPQGCRFRLQDEGRAYPRSGCAACGKTITTGLGRACDSDQLRIADVSQYYDTDVSVSELSAEAVEPKIAGLTPLEVELLAALKLFRDTIIGEVNDKWDEGMRAGKLIAALGTPTLKYRADITTIHSAIDKAEALAATAPEGSR